MKKMTPNEYYKALKYQKKQIAKSKQVQQDNKIKIETIIDSDDKVVIKYPEYREAFDYVESKFPGLNVLNVTIFKVPRKSLEKAGYGGVGGLYVFHKKQVIVSDDPTGGMSGKKSIKANLSVDEVIVHELLHYVSHKFSNSNSVLMEEEFAYGNSVPYLLSKGYTDKEIVIGNMLPFLYDQVDDQKVLTSVLKKKNITKAQFNSILRSAKKEGNKSKYQPSIDAIFEETHDAVKQKAYEAGMLLVDKYRDVPDGELDEGDSEYSNINI